MMDGISIPIRKLQKKKNSILLKYRSHQNKKILLTKSKIKYNVIVLRDNII